MFPLSTWRPKGSAALQRLQASQREALLQPMMAVAENLVKLSVESGDDKNLGLGSSLVKLVASSTQLEELHKRAKSFLVHFKLAESVVALKKDLGLVEGDLDAKVVALKNVSHSYTTMAGDYAECEKLGEKMQWTEQVPDIKVTAAEVARGVVEARLAGTRKAAAAVGGGASDKKSWKASLPDNPEWSAILQAAEHLVSQSFAKTLDGVLKQCNSDHSRVLMKC